MTTSAIHAQMAELRSAAATLRQPGGTTTDRISAELLERAAQTIAVLQRAPLPATAVTALLPVMQDSWSTEDYGTWVVRAAERAHGIGGDTPNPPPPSWAEAPKGFNFRAMDSDGRWHWFKNRPYTETLGDYDGWDSEDGIRAARGLNFYANWKDTLQERPKGGTGAGDEGSLDTEQLLVMAALAQRNAAGDSSVIAARIDQMADEVRSGHGEEEQSNER